MIHFKITALLLRDAQVDLRRPHAIASERVGFLACRLGEAGDDLLLLARRFEAVADEHYVDDPTVGAAINGDAIRLAMQHAYAHRDAMMFVHEHAGRGPTWPSRVDLDCWRRMIPNFWNVSPDLPHGALILTHDHGMGQVWLPGSRRSVSIDRFTVVGAPLRRWRRPGTSC